MSGTEIKELHQIQQPTEVNRGKKLQCTEENYMKQKNKLEMLNDLVETMKSNGPKDEITEIIEAIRERQKQLKPASFSDKKVKIK